MKLTSSPRKNSSITTVLPAVPKQPESMRCAVSSAASCVSQMTTPLPAASPSAFTTTGRRRARRPEAGSPFLGESIDDAGDERGLGTHDGELHALARREPEQSFDVPGR